MRFLIPVIYLLFFISCKKEETDLEIPGCLDVRADNYNKNASISNGTCEYSQKISFYLIDSNATENFPGMLQVQMNYDDASGSYYKKFEALPMDGEIPNCETLDSGFVVNHIVRGDSLLINYRVYRQHRYSPSRGSCNGAFGCSTLVSSGKLRLEFDPNVYYCDALELK